MSMRRFDTPAAPPGWAGQGAELLRVVDPTGRAIAWLAPGVGGTCVGYAVRRAGDATGGWRHILRSGGPRELRADPLGYGCAVLGPDTSGLGLAHLAPWQFVERDPTAATCTALCGPAGSGGAFAVRLDLTARLEDAALHLDLRATNEGEEAVPVAPGLQVCLAEGFRGDGQPGSGDRLATFASVDGAMRAVVATDLGALGGIVRTAGTRHTVEVPGAMLSPRAQIGIAVVIAVAWGDS